MFQPAEKVGVVVLTNGDDSRPEQIADRAFQMIGEPLAQSDERESRAAEASCLSDGVHSAVWVTSSTSG